MGNCCNSRAEYLFLLSEELPDRTFCSSVSYRAKGETARRGQNGSYHPPGYLSRHRKKGPVDLASEAKEVVKAVKALIEVERKCLWSHFFMGMSKRIQRGNTII